LTGPGFPFLLAICPDRKTCLPLRTKVR
jgi:hypothetical protein